MTVRWILAWRAAPGKTVSAETFKQLREQLQAFRCGQLEHHQRMWAVNVTGYDQVSREQAGWRKLGRSLFTVEMNDQPSTTFLIARESKQVVAANKNAMQVMDRLDMFQPRISIMMRGVIYSFGDFDVQIGTASQKDVLKACLLTVDYRPLDSFQVASGFVQEFLDMLQQALAIDGGRFEVIETAFSDFGLPNDFTPQHAALQYASLVWLQ